MRSINLRALVLSAAAATVLLASTWASAGDDSRESRAPQVLSSQQVRALTGKSVGQWAAKWWQWAFDHPEVLSDTTGEFGPLGNVGGPVFYALGSGGDPVRARYEVPGGQFILIPVASYIWTFFDPCVDVSCAAEIVNHNFLDGITDVNLFVDGERVRGLRSHFVRLDEDRPLVFNVDAGPIQDDGYGGILPAVQAGVWVMLAPLSPGKHHISMQATVPQIDPLTGELLNGYLDLDARLQLQVRGRKPGAAMP